MSPILVIAFGIALGFLILFVILWLIVMLTVLIFGERVAETVQNIFRL